MRFKSYIESITMLIELIDNMQCVEKETEHAIDLFKSIPVGGLEPMVAKNQEILANTHENKFMAQQELGSKISSLCGFLVEFGFLPRDFKLQK